ncbi:MAG: LapA family protein [Desulfobacteraceae bacterium]|nr:MAG: LapA family protein [Desulfobacteraceae bacterium]
MNAKLIIGLILAFMVILFTIQNVTVMELRFLFWTLSMSRSLFMFLILSVGIILGWLLHGGFNRRKNMTQDKDWPSTDRKGEGNLNLKRVPGKPEQNDNGFPKPD